MNIVKKLNKHTIYYYCDNKIKYYINVPHREFDTTNISIEFLEDISKFDPEFNDIKWVKSNIIDYYEKVDNDNITLILPLLKNDEKNNLLTLNVNKLNMIERLMALYINSGYIILTKNNINVNKEVFLIENDRYINFIKYFKEKHNTRIIVKRLIEISSSENIEKNTYETKPFSINENILNEILNINKNNNVNNLVIEDIATNKKLNDDLENKDLLNSEKINNNVDISKKIIELNNNQTEISDIIENKNFKTFNKITTENNKQEDIINEKEDIINEKEDINNTSSDNIIESYDKEKLEPINNIINISDLGSLASTGLNGNLPSNVTINIEKLVTENKKPIKSSEKIEEDDEVSELDEDVSDIDEFDENEDFDLDAIDVSEAVLSSDDGNKTYRTVTSGGIKFVVGRKDDENIKPIEINKSNSIDLNEKNDLKIDMPTNIVKGDDQINKNAGFASYFTLFFVAISAIFIIVYIIIK